VVDGSGSDGDYDPDGLGAVRAVTNASGAVTQI